MRFNRCKIDPTALTESAGVAVVHPTGKRERSLQILSDRGAIVGGEQVCVGARADALLNEPSLCTSRHRVSGECESGVLFRERILDRAVRTRRSI